MCICICVYIMLFRNWNNCADIYKLFYMIIDYPFTLCRNATIPIYDSTKWNKTIFTFFPLFTLIFFTIIFNCKYHYYIYNQHPHLHIVYPYFTSHLIIFCLCITISLLCSLFLHYTTSPKSIPSYPLCISLLTFIMSLIWIWFIANNLIDLFKAIGLLFRIPDTFLGMTVLTYGNSISDLVLNISLVKSGYGEMALAGSISGPLFNLLVGLGSSLLKMNISHGTIAIDFYSTSNIISVIAVFILILNLLLLLYQSHSHAYILNKRFISYSGFIIYATFLVLICYNTFLQ